MSLPNGAVAFRRFIHLGGSSYTWTRWFDDPSCPSVLGDPIKTEYAYPQATVDTLRAQLEAAEAGNHRRSDSEPTWAELTQHWKARAEAAEADAQRWRAWRSLDEHAASDIAWAYDAMGRDTAIDVAIARTKERQA